MTGGRKRGEKKEGDVERGRNGLGGGGGQEREVKNMGKQKHDLRTWKGLKGKVKGGEMKCAWGGGNAGGELGGGSLRKGQIVSESQ